jgi:hypothetical protein
MIQRIACGEERPQLRFWHVPAIAPREDCKAAERFEAVVRKPIGSTNAEEAAECGEERTRLAEGRNPVLLGHRHDGPLKGGKGCRRDRRLGCADNAARPQRLL